jgi:integrase
MARATRDVRLETRTARAGLRIARRYWRTIGKGLALGYRKGAHGGSWYVRLAAAGNRYQVQSIGIADDHRDADGLAVLDYFQAQDKARAKAGQITEAATRYTVKQATDDYFAWAELNQKSAPKTRAVIKRHIVPALGARLVCELTKPEIEVWLRGLVRAPSLRQRKHADPEAERRRKSSANRILTVLKAALNKAFADDKVSSDSAWRRVKPFTNVDAARKVFFTVAQCKHLINRAHGGLRAYVQAALYSGARPGKELEALKVRDLDAATGTLHVADGKTGARHVHLSSEGVAFFARLAAGRDPDAPLLLKDDGTPWGLGHHVRPMKQLIAEAKLPREANAYALRHTYISLALLNGVNVQVLAENCGTSLRMVEKHYGKFLNADRRKMFERAAPRFGLKRDNVRVLR